MTAARPSQRVHLPPRVPLSVPHSAPVPFSYLPVCSLRCLLPDIPPRQQRRLVVMHQMAVRAPVPKRRAQVVHGETVVGAHEPRPACEQAEGLGVGQPAVAAARHVCSGVSLTQRAQLTTT